MRVLVEEEAGVGHGEGLPQLREQLVRRERHDLELGEGVVQVGGELRTREGAGVGAVSAASGTTGGGAARLLAHPERHLAASDEQVDRAVVRAVVLRRRRRLRLRVKAVSRLSEEDGSFQSSWILRMTPSGWRRCRHPPDPSTDLWKRS